MSDPWPAGAAEVLARVPFLSARVRNDLVGRHGVDEGSGTSDGVIVEAGPFCLKTSARRRFATLESARRALQTLAGFKEKLETLAPLPTVLCLAFEEPAEPPPPSSTDDRDHHDSGLGAYWLWTVTDWLPTIRGLLRQAAAAGDEAAVEAALQVFASGARRSLEITLRHELVLDVHPSNFARTPTGDVVYIDDDFSTGSQAPSIGYALLRRVEEYASFPDALERYAVTLDRELVGLGAAALEKLRLAHHIEDAPVRSAPAQRLRDRLHRSVNRAAAHVG